MSVVHELVNMCERVQGNSVESQSIFEKVTRTSTLKKHKQECMSS